MELAINFHPVLSLGVNETVRLLMTRQYGIVFETSETFRFNP